MYNNKVKIRRYGINKGEALVIFVLSFKTFDLKFDFKHLNCRGVKINNYTQILL